MRRQLDEIRLLCVQQDAPLFIAGDLFDKWNPPPELINFAIKYLPKCYAIPGQHDLPFHSYKDIKKSAYWTLVEAGIVTDLAPGEAHRIKDVVVHAFPWGYDVKPCYTPPHTFGMNVCMAHKYVWHENRCYPGAPEEKSLDETRGSFEGYEAVFIGDNHKAWRDGSVVNCGGLFRRKSDEEGESPAVYLLKDNGGIARHPLAVVKDVFLRRSEVDKFVKSARTVEEFMEELGDLTESAIDFREAVNTYMDDNAVPVRVRDWIVRAMEE